jgi:hypothetical protein
MSHMVERVCHIVALPFTLKICLNAKDELRKLKYFTIQKYNLQKYNPLKETKLNPSRYFLQLSN